MATTLWNGKEQCSTAEDAEVAAIKAQLTASDGTVFKFGIDANGNYGYYKPGESTVTPFYHA